MHVPLATAISDVAEARRDYMDESGGRYVQVIADGGMGDSGSFVTALAMGAQPCPIIATTDCANRENTISFTNYSYFLHILLIKENV